MPTVHKGVGMNRAKKRKLSPLVPGPIVVEDTPEPEEACPAPAPAPSPSPPPTAREEPKQDTRDVPEIVILWYRMKQTEKDFIKVQDLVAGRRRQLLLEVCRRRQALHLGAGGLRAEVRTSSPPSRPRIAPGAPPAHPTVPGPC